ncbi:MAG: porphobilinogen deaminase [Francisellaceae bacterium]|nr:porphobilinogen deaminase [Francisellaceae bacterium]
MHEIRIVSRKSPLALIQAEVVKSALLKLYPQLEITIKGISTQGDEILDKPLAQIGGKGLFVKELEIELINKRADIAVHSMKDLPAELPNPLIIGAILKRNNPFDAFVSMNYPSLQNLPLGAHVGTSSLRRQSQLLHYRPDLKISSLRGNVETRLQKLKNKEFDAIVLAHAGLTRLSLDCYVAQSLEKYMLPAVGQGALGIECRQEDKDILELIKPLNDPITSSCLEAERALNAKLGGSCQAPIGGYAFIENQKIYLKGLVAEPAGRIMITEKAEAEPKDAKLLGEKLAQDLLDKGADALIAQLKL